MVDLLLSMGRYMPLKLRFDQTINGKMQLGSALQSIGIILCRLVVVTPLSERSIRYQRSAFQIQTSDIFLRNYHFF